MLVLGLLMPVIGLIIGGVLHKTHIKWRMTPIDWLTLSLLIASDILILVRYHYQAISLLIMPGGGERFFTTPFLNYGGGCYSYQVSLHI